MLPAAGELSRGATVERAPCHPVWRPPHLGREKCRNEFVE